MRIPFEHATIGEGEIMTQPGSFSLVGEGLNPINTVSGVAPDGIQPMPQRSVAFAAPSATV